jgi:hypothetical protein
MSFRPPSERTRAIGNSFGITEATIDSACWFVGDGESTTGARPLAPSHAHYHPTRPISWPASTQPGAAGRVSGVLFFRRRGARGWRDASLIWG